MTDAWLQQYREASFRNVKFYINAHEHGGGRRLATHEFPQRDEPYTQDLGRRVRRFSLTAYVLGVNYFPQRNALLTECEKGGRGLLVHPYLGSRLVQLENFRLRETTLEGRIARFTLDFVESGEYKFPEPIVDAEDSITTARQAALRAINNWFISVYSLARKPWNVVQNARANIAVGTQAINSAKKILQTVPEFNDAVEDMIVDVASLSRDAADLAISTIDLLSFGTLSGDKFFQATIENARLQFEGLKELFGYKAETTVSTVDDEDDPAQLYAALVGYSALVVVSGLTGVMEYDSIEDAKEVTTDIINQIDIILLTEGLDDNIAVSLKDLQKIIVESIDLKDVDLSRISTVILNISLPALVLSYGLYGTGEQEQDILDRNKLGNPGFVPANQEIEVLLNV